jgi:hypothetical protein
MYLKSEYFRIRTTRGSIELYWSANNTCDCEKPVPQEIYLNFVLYAHNAACELTKWYCWSYRALEKTNQNNKIVNINLGTPFPNHNFTLLKLEKQKKGDIDRLVVLTFLFFSWNKPSSLNLPDGIGHGEDTDVQVIFI